MAAAETLCNNAIDSKHNSVVGISSNQEILTLALRTLRLSKTNLNSASTDNVSADRQIINLNEVSHHDTANDCWIVLFDRVYDVTAFLDKVSANFEISEFHK